MTNEKLMALGRYALRAQAEYANRPADDRAETEAREPRWVQKASAGTLPVQVATRHSRES